MKAMIAENNNKNSLARKFALGKVAEREKLIEAAKRVAGSLKDVDIPGWETSKSAAQWVHDLRHMGTEEFAKKITG